jgi:hypothetical protein
MKPLITEPSSGKQPLQGIFFAGSLTGGLVAPVTSPFITLKLQQQVATACTVCFAGCLCIVALSRLAAASISRRISLPSGRARWLAAKACWTRSQSRSCAAPQPDALVGSRYTRSMYPPQPSPPVAFAAYAHPHVSRLLSPLAHTRLLLCNRWCEPASCRV